MYIYIYVNTHIYTEAAFLEKRVSGMESLLPMSEQDRRLPEREREREILCIYIYIYTYILYVCVCICM